MAATSDDSTSAKQSEVSPTDRQVALNLVRLRAMRGVSTTRLAAALKSAGRSIPATGITRIEKEQRRVDAGDLVALAAALGVSPMTLLLPWPDDPDVEGEITGMDGVTARDVWDWALGLYPLTRSTTDPVGDAQRFRLDSLPPWARIGPADAELVGRLRAMVLRLAHALLLGEDDPGFVTAIRNGLLLDPERDLELRRLQVAAAGRTAVAARAAERGEDD